MPDPITVREPAELLPFLFAQWSSEKKGQVRNWLKFRAVTVNGAPTSQFNHPLKRGDVVALRTVRFSGTRAVLEMNIKLVFEDASILVVEKPENMLVVAAPGERERTVSVQLADYLRAVKHQSTDRPWTIERLDRETSGLMVFARSEAIKNQLRATWTTSRKRYEAVVEGHPPAAKGVLESFLDERGAFKVRIVPEGSETRKAVTRYRELARNGRRSWLALEPETDRRHQMRAQLAELGCPIAGDKKYGAKTDPIRRLALHCCHLEFTHPATRKVVSFDSPLPTKLLQLTRPPTQKPPDPPAARRKKRPKR